MMNKQIIISVSTILFALFIAYVIYIANSGKPAFFMSWVKSIPYGDKLGHFCLIGGMCLLLNLALKLKKIKIAKYKILLGSIIIFSIITIEEFSQIFIDTRTFDLIDLCFNYLGILVFSFVAIFLEKFIWNEKESN